MRIVFIHGLGETNDIFNKISTLLAGEHSFINLWEALGTERRRGLTPLHFCEELIERYGIQTSDIIIGHSTGGRLAYLIKHLNGNPIVQIASWTDQSKLVSPIKSVSLTLLLVRTGVLLSKRVGASMIKRYKNREDSKPFYVEAMNNLRNGNRNTVVNQFKLALLPVKESITVVPDLRIHAKKDNIVRYPDEDFIEVPGDHFSLVIHPDDVAKHINTYLTGE